MPLGRLGDGQQAREPVHVGTAHLRPGRSYDLVLAHEVGVPEDVRRLELPVLGRWARPHRGADPWRTPLPPWAMRLSRELRALRRTRGPVALDVDWADDGHTCRLVGARAALS